MLLDRERVARIAGGLLYAIVAVIAAPVLFLAVALWLLLDKLDGYNKR